MSGEEIPVRLGPLGYLRWAWRRLTRMSTAIVLLAIVALAAIPGGVLPQRNRDAAAVTAYIAAHPGWGPFADRLSLFSVFSSPWFVACYLLLFISLVGCIIPRCITYARALRAGPAPAPRRLDSLEGYRVDHLDLPPGEAISTVRAAIGRPYRIAVGGAPDAEGATTLTAVRGRAREAGNLVFHLGLVACLIALTFGQAFEHSGQIVLTEGSSAANALVDYDSFSSGVLFDPARLEPFTLTLDSFTARFATDARPDFFEATVTSTQDGRRTVHRIRVNGPATIGGTGVYLMGNGYAPHITVRGADGAVAFSGFVPFLARDAQYTSDGVIKVPDIAGGRQLGLAGQLFPAAVRTNAGYVSARPEALNPRLELTAYAGDLGLDAGVPQNVYQLDTSAMTRLDQTPLDLELGATARLPGDMGTITFDSLRRYAAFDLTANPGAGWLLAAVLAATAGLIVSLFTPRRRLYVRATADGAGSRVELAGAADGSFTAGEDLERLLRRLEPHRLRDAPDREEIAK